MCIVTIYRKSEIPEHLRKWFEPAEIGLESTPEAYVARMVEVFREVRRVLRGDGCCWINLGDTFASGKQLVGIPWRVAFALQADGWLLRQDIIWQKTAPMPESVTDRCTKAHEYVFLMTKSERYFYDAAAVSEASVRPGDARLATQRNGVCTGQDWNGSTRVFSDNPTRRNRRSVWTITTKPYSGAHFAVMPPDLVEPCIKAGCPEQCCPACGKGWERVIEKKSYRPEVVKDGVRFVDASRTDKTRKLNGKSKEWLDAAASIQTLGWQPACDCVASGTIPGTVLDPFAGSGTTLAVAAEQGRSGIGCELNPEYIALAKKRISEARESVALFEGIS